MGESLEEQIMAKTEGRLRKVYWPTLDSQESAKKAAHMGAAAVGLSAVVIALIAILNITGVTDHFMGGDASFFLEAGICAALAILIYRFSRIAAVLALLLFVLEKLMALENGPAHQNLVMTIIWTLFYVNGVRGTFAWHRFKELESAEQAGVLSAPKPGVRSL
jgi:hypothetical protein